MKHKNFSRAKRRHGGTAQLYYFEPQGPGWSDYQDDDGIELKSDAKALANAHTIIEELKELESGQPLHMLVKNAARKTIFRIAVK